MPDNIGGYVSSITADINPSVGYFSSAQVDGTPYNRYNIRQHFHTHHGLYQLPTAGSVGIPARVVRLHAPYSSKIITWIIEMNCEAGTKPILPHWDTQDPNEVCIEGEVRIDAPVLQMSGTVFFWHVEGEYHYVSGYAGRTAMSGGSSPAITLPTESFGINEGHFSKEFLRSVSSSPKGTVVFNGMVFDSALV